MEFGKLTFNLRNPDNRTGRALAAGVSAAAALALIASGCGGSGSAESSKSSTESPHKSGGNEPTLTFNALTFDDLGGGSSVIEVFPSPTDKQYNGTYYDGDQVDPICKTQGREVHSDPKAGEQNRQSDEWIRIHGSPGETEYATAVYVEHPAQLLHQLPEC
jgi:hypothetical protein